MKIKYIEVKNDASVILRGMRHIAENNPNGEVYIIIHGYFSANKIGPQRFFVKMANYLCGLGYNVYRFDLSGMGESDGEIEKIQFSDHVNDLKCILKHIKKIEGKNTVTNIIAHCLGCNIAIENIKNNISNIQFGKVFFLAPFFSNIVTLTKFLGGDNYQELLRNNSIYRKGLYSDPTFFDENTDTDFEQDLKLIDKKIQIFLPEDDQFIPLKMSLNTFRKQENISINIVNGADHNFLEVQDQIIKLIGEYAKEK